jgi:hypothetical protein
VKTRPARETTFVNASCRARLGTACAYAYITPMRHDNRRSLVADFGMPVLGAEQSQPASALRSSAAAAASPSARGHGGGASPVAHYDQRVVKAALDRAGLGSYAWAQPSWHPAGTALQARVGSGALSGCWGFDALSAPLGGGAWSAVVHERMHRGASEAVAIEAAAVAAAAKEAEEREVAASDANNESKESRRAAKKKKEKLDKAGKQKGL